MTNKIYKTRKFISSLLLVVVFVMSFSTVMAQNTNTDTIVYGADVTTYAGAIVDFPISIQNNPGVSAYALEFSYDSENFTLVAADASGAFLDEFWVTELNGDRLLWAMDNMNYTTGQRELYNVEGDGEMASLKFQVSSSAAPGIYPVEIALIDDEEGNISNCDAEAVPVILKAGVIRILPVGGEKVITNVTLYTPSDKLAYWVGEEFVVDGAQLKVEYSDETSDFIDVTPEMLEAIPDMTTAGTKTIQVKYQNWEYVNDLTFDITVKVPGVSNVEMTSAPDKKEYDEGDTFDVTGGKIKITYEDESFEFVDITEDMCSGYDMSVPGEYEVKVSYMGYEFFFTIKVNAAEIPDSGDFDLTVPFVSLILAGMCVCATLYTKKKKD